ncbi:Acetolactate synthase [Sterolibacterium denitrificans]|uniref:Acetolactate synthase n=1 Tax=Sterolibacterium denitrificans TaxID=157592 RepID=A0A7Z7HPB3_9PROT|nr:thiamine pyrophosphate-binding protein [Sterolibacterium denitrificans]SMB22135.1 Acetolactate synthase [Sterolibacterium denitrificans]
MNDRVSRGVLDLDVALARASVRAVDASTHPELAGDAADLLVAYLEQIGIEYVFGVPGGAIEPLYNALARSARRGGLKHILARHEAGAAYMADGYARETGKLGVCCSTAGPGATNLITGVACARENGIPMLVITGQPALPLLGRNALQESSCTGINTLSMMQHCTHYNTMVSHPDQMEAKLVTALQHAIRPPRGPVHLSFPSDVFRTPLASATPSYDLKKLLRPSSLIDEEALTELVDRLNEARKIVILVGGWCGEGIGAMLQFATLRNAAVVTTPDGKGLLSPRHPLFRGVFGFGGHGSADEVLQDPSVDLILAVGARMGEWNSGGWNKSLMNERLVHIDESEEHLALTPMARLHVRGRIVSIFDRLIEQANQESRCEYEQQRAEQAAQAAVWEPESILAERDKCLSDSTPIKPQRLFHELGRLFPQRTRYLADTGNSVAWAIHYLQPSDRRLGDRRLGGGIKRVISRRQSSGGWLRLTMNFVPMGWAIGGAVGTAAANPDGPVVCITGDGSMLMNGQELSVAVAEQLTIVFVVLNDQSLGMVRHGQRLTGAEQHACTLPSTDFAALARALGATAHTIASPQDLLNLDIETICARKGPTLLDVRVAADEVPPMSVRMRVLAASL